MKTIKCSTSDQKFFKVALLSIELFVLGFFEGEKGFFDNSENVRPGFLNGEREKFNFNEDGKNPDFPGDERNDIPVLPQIETSEEKEPNVHSGLKTIRYKLKVLKVLICFVILFCFNYKSQI